MKWHHWYGMTGKITLWHVNVPLGKNSSDIAAIGWLEIITP